MSNSEKTGTTARSRLGAPSLRRTLSKSFIGKSIAALHRGVNDPEGKRISPANSADSVAEKNYRFAADAIRASCEGNSENGTSMLYAEEVIKFFIKGVSGKMFQNYVNYALRSLTRGQKLVDLYCPPDREPARYLDVGCAYGGPPVAMAKRGVPHAVGFEFDERLLKLAAILAMQEGVADQVKFVGGDLTKHNDVSTLGTFDLVTCIDVLEHVLDPDAAIKNLAVLAGKGGTVIVDVPNPECFETIDRDPHHHLFGSVLLERNDAIRAFEDEFPGNKRYTVGYFHPLEWYLERLRAAGFKVDVMDAPPCDDSAVAKTLEGLDGMRENFSESSAKWPEWRRDLVHSALDNFYLQAGDYGALAASDTSAFQLKHAVPVVHIRCTATGAARAPVAH